jgi:hypothetical protein
MKVLDWEFTKESKVRSLVCVTDCSFSQNWGVHNNTLRNLGRALHERVFKVSDGCGGLKDPPRPNPGVLEQYRTFREEWVKSLSPCRWSSHQDVLRGYSGRKAKRYTNAYESLLQYPVNDTDAELTAFLKAEKTNLSAKPDPAPRLIQFPNPRYSLELMTYLKFNEKNFMNAIDAVWGEKVVMSGLNCEDLGYQMKRKWDMFDDVIAVPLDFSRFDQHCSSAALQYEFDFYTAAFPGDEYLQWLLSFQKTPKGRAVAGDGAIEYVCPQGGRGSGQINTSMGNKLIVCSLMWEYFHEVGLNASLANMGDDCTIFLNKSQFKLLDRTLKPWWLKVGYNAVVEDVCHELEHIEFCQSHPVLVENHWVMVRSPLKSLTKDCLTLQSVETPAQIGASYMAISTCGRIINSGVPISYALHNCLYRASSKYTKMVEISDEFMFKNVEYGNYERMKGLKHVRRNVADSTRLSYYKAFGITPDIQILLEDYYNQLDLDFGQGVENVNSIEFYSAFSDILLDKPSL